MNQKIILVISILIGVLAFGLSIKYFKSEAAKVQSELNRIYAGATQVSIVVAKRDIPEGIAITKDDLAFKRVLQQEVKVAGNAVLSEDVDLLLGRKTLFQIKHEEPIYWRFIEGGQRAARGLAYSVKPGMRAISLNVSGAASVSSMIQPNDRVDILGTFTLPSREILDEMETVTLTVLQDVTVLATGSLLANQPINPRANSRSRAYSTITVSVTPREAELLVFAQQAKGRLTMSLRNPTDDSFEKDLPSVNFQLLERTLPDLNLYRQRNIRYKKEI
jgi:pilus assembly protein CpaB